MAWTPEMRAAAREKALARRREEAAAKVKAAPEEEPPMAMPSVGTDWREPAAVEEPEPEPAAEAPATEDPFELFLAAQDEEVRSILSDVELRVIYEAETKKAKEARREATKKLAQTRAARVARVNEGLVSEKDATQAEWLRKMNRKVRWTPALPQDANGNLIDEGYRVDGHLLFHGIEVEGTYGQWLDNRWQQFASMNHEMDFEGKGRLSHQRQMSAGALIAKL